MSVLVRGKTVFNFYCFAASETRLFSKNDRRTVFSNKHMENSRTYHGLLHVLVRENTLCLWAYIVNEIYNLDSDEILWLLDRQTLMQSFLWKWRTYSLLW